jgi:hypothetical protein
MENNTFKYKEVSITKSFQSKSAKPSSLILRKCLLFIYNRVLEGYREEIPGKVFDLKFREEIGDDRLTLKKYFGNNKRVLTMDGMGKRKFLRGAHEPGAFERYGLVERVTPMKYSDVTLTWRILPYFWIKLKEVYPQRKIAEFRFQRQEGLGVGKEGNISLIEAKGDDVEAEENGEDTKRLHNNNTNSERDIFYGELTPEELAVLTAKPIDSEPDRSKPIRRISNGS